MAWWLLLALICFVWLLLGVAEAAQVAVKIMRGQWARDQGGVPLTPNIIAALVFWGAAELIDLAADPWGTIAICSLHVAVAPILVASIIRDSWLLRSGVEPPPPNPDAPSDSS